MMLTFLEVVKAACPELSEAEILERDRKILEKRIKLLNKPKAKKRVMPLDGIREDYPNLISLAEMANLIPLSHSGIRDMIRHKGIKPIILHFRRRCYMITKDQFKEVFGV